MGLLVCLVALAGFSQVSNVSDDEMVVLFPGVIYPVQTNGDWELHIEGSVYEPKKRTLMVKFVEGALGIRERELTNGQKQIFLERTRLFLVDSEKNKNIVVQVGGQNFALNKSKANGHFHGTFKLDATRG